VANAGLMMRRIDEVGRHSGWFIALGAAFIIGGALAILMPLVASLAVAFTLGWMFILIGVVELVQAWQIRDWGGAIWQAIIGAIILIGGIATVTDPIAATVTLTLLVGIVLILKGASQIALGVTLRPHRGWGWVVAAGVLAALIGLMIISAWPISGAWVLGTFAGISLIFTGWSYIMMATTARQLTAR
jgi:uncharacterized membrane protein HdeD (DUF308 family)